VTEVRPLYYHGEPTEEQRIALRRGKDKLGVDWMVQPKMVGTNDSPELPVLVFGEPDRYFEKYALLTWPYSADRMAAALAEVYGLTSGEYLSTGKQWLEGALGAEVKDLGEEEL
jgi:hypothetical protein